MKKITKIILLQVLIIFLIISPVKAEEIPCKISFSSSKTILQPGEEVTVSMLMSNITASEGIQYISGILDYSTDVFEIIYDETDLAEDKLVQFEDDGTDEDNIGMIYVGENDTSATGNKWDVVLLYDEETNSNGILAYSEEKQTQEQTIAKIKFKVKSDAPKTDTKISLKQALVFSMDDDDEGMKIEDASVPFTIKGKETPASSTVENKNNENVKQKKGVNKTNTNNNQQTSNQGTPYTGIDDYFPVIAVIILATVISYFNYKKYKDIK